MDIFTLKQNLLRAKIKVLRLIDDVFFAKIFGKSIEETQFVLRIILSKPDLIVVSVKLQYDIDNLYGRSARLDILAKDSNGVLYDIEAQRSSGDAPPKRGRQHSSLIDADFSEKNTDWNQLPETYVIFITENDYFKAGKPIYHIERTVRELDNAEYGDFAHIVYVNGLYRGNDDIGKLMHDFSCENPEDMYFKNLRDKASFYKKTKEGEIEMSDVLDDLIEDFKNLDKVDAALKMIEDGMPEEKIIKYTGLSISRVNELVEQYRLQPV